MPIRMSAAVLKQAANRHCAPRHFRDGPVLLAMGPVPGAGQHHFSSNSFQSDFLPLWAFHGRDGCPTVSGMNRHKGDIEPVPVSGANKRFRYDVEVAVVRSVNSRAIIENLARSTRLEHMEGVASNPKASRRALACLVKRFRLLEIRPLQRKYDYLVPPKNAKWTGILSPTLFSLIAHPNADGKLLAKVIASSNSFHYCSDIRANLRKFNSVGLLNIASALRSLRKSPLPEYSPVCFYMDSSQEYLLGELAKVKSLPPEAYVHFAALDCMSVAEVLEKAPPEVHVKIAALGIPSFCSRLIERKESTAEVIAACANTPDARLRVWIANDDRTPKNTLLQLLHDGDYWVRMYALAHLADLSDEAANTAYEHRPRGSVLRGCRWDFIRCLSPRGSRVYCAWLLLNHQYKRAPACRLSSIWQRKAPTVAQFLDFPVPDFLGAEKAKPENAAPIRVLPHTFLTARAFPPESPKIQKRDY